MSEMLGNQYFLARKYDLARTELQTSLLKDAKNKGICRKLIICYTQTGEIDRALEIFLSLIKEDVDYIINTDPIDDDCPCPEIVFDLEKEIPNNKNSKNFTLTLGMLWLYCDLKKSIDYFINAQRLATNDSTIKSILIFLNSRFDQKNKTQNKSNQIREEVLD
jgi:tetratricopeptide (TPR) repeat protein